MRRVLALVVASASLAACLFPDLYGLSGDAGGTTDALATETGSDASTRIKDITFENGLLIDPALGVQTLNLPVALLDGGALSGNFSAATTQPSSDAGNQQSALIQDFAPPASLYVSMLVRVDAVPAIAARFVKIGNNQTTLELSIVPIDATTFTIRFRLRISTTTTTDKVLGESAAFPIGQTLRLGFVLTQQSGADAGDAVVQGFLAQGTAAFGPPIVTSNVETLLGPSDEIVLGASTPDFIGITFDDVRLDSAQMPEP